MSEPRAVLPGEELFEEGRADLAAGRLTEAGLLLAVVAPRLRRLGLELPDPPCPRPFEHQLYARLNERLGDGAHSHYNSLLRRLDSYAHALEREASRRAVQRS